MNVSPHERWRLYECSDCHPDVSEYDKPYQVALPFERLPDGGDPAVPGTSCPLAYCPRCDGYLSLCDSFEVRLERVA